MKIVDTAKVHRYTNAIRRKLHNNHVTLCRGEDESYYLEVVNYDKKFAAQPCIIHQVKRNVLRISHFIMSKQTLEAFILNAVELLNSKDSIDIHGTPIVRDIRANAKLIE